jgi:pyruvate/2-oxoglutarate dehydrogenase complex dihydrolipoamide acyltransferase (E2) component
MQLRLEFPSLPTPVSGALVARWHVSEGDRVEFGDDLVDLTITEIEHLSRPRRRGNLRRAESDRRVGRRVQFDVRLTASEPGVLRHVTAAPETAVAVGDVLAILSTDPHEPVDRASAGAAAFRVVANTLDVASEPEGIEEQGR